MKHEIDVVISDGGKIEATVVGIEGATCKDLTKWLSKIGQVIEHNVTKDFFKKEKVLIKGKVSR